MKTPKLSLHFTDKKKKSEEIERLKAENQSLLTYKEGLENANKAVNDLQNDNKDKQERLNSYKTKYTELEQKHVDQNDKFEELKRKYEDTSNNLEELKQKYKDQNDKFEELKRQYKDQSNNLEELKELKRQYKDQNGNFEELKRQYKDQSNNLEELNQKYKDQSNNFEELKQKYKDQNDGFKELKRQYKDQNDNFEELKRQYKDQSNNFEELKQKYNQSDNFEELKQKYKDQSDNFEELKQKYKDQSDDFEELKQKHKDQSDDFEELKQKFSEQNDNFEELKQKYKDQKVNFEDLKQERDKQILAYKILNQNYKDQNDNFEELKQKHGDQSLAFEELKQKYKDQIVNLEELKQEKEYFESGYNRSEQQLKEKNSQIISLKQKNKDLENEASKYQSALGIATNFDFNVDDQNHNVKLNQDILSLQDTLENYITNLKPKIDVNINEVRKLLIKYGCQSKISNDEPNKPLIKVVLQRHVLEEILSQADYYFKSFKDSNKEHHLESNIVTQAAVLNSLMEKFYNNRLGDDEITRITPIRLRQQVYTALGTRGFNDIKKADGEISKHNFIDIISNHINKMMNKYRKINDNEKRKYVNALAENLVRNVVRIFYFRLPIQEPMAQCRWFNNNEKINISYMKGSWDEDEIEDMVVEICSFPMIYKPEDDGDKICTPAKVFPIHIMNPSLQEKLMDVGMSIGRKLFYSSNDDSNSTKFDESDEYDSDQTNLTEPDESNYHSHNKIE